MPATITKVWDGSQSGQVGNAAHGKNWKPVSIRNSIFRWEASGSGTNEFYLDLTGGGDPSIPEPQFVQEGGSDLTAGTAGSLSAGEWDYADNDTLGYSTIYVRLADDTDPDSKNVDHVEYIDVPRASDHVVIPAGSQALSSNLDLSATEIASFRREIAHAASVGTEDDPLRLKVSNAGQVYLAGTQTAYIDLTDSATAVEVTEESTLKADSGARLLYLTGTAMTTLQITRGIVGLASLAGQSARVDVIELGYVTSGTRESDADLEIGASVTDVAGTGKPDLTMEGGNATSRSDVDNLTLLASGESSYEQLEGDWATATIYGGTAVPNSSQTYATTVLAGGAIDLAGLGVTPTFTNMTIRRESTFNDPAGRSTFTNDIQFPDGVGPDANLTLDLGRARKFTPVNI